MGRIRVRRKRSTVALAAAATVTLVTPGAWADPNATVDYTIKNATPASWSVATDWTTSLPEGVPTGGPDSPGLYVSLRHSISNVRVVTVFNSGDAGDATKTIGRLDIGDSSGYGASDRFRISAGTGNGVLDFDGNGGTAQINTTTFTSGDQIDAGIILSSNLDVTNNATNTASTLRFSSVSAASAQTLTLKKSLVLFNSTVNPNVTLRLGDASGTYSAGMSFVSNTYNSNIIAQSGSTDNTLTVSNSGNTTPVFAGLVTLDHDLTVRSNGTGSVTLSGTVSGAALTGSSNLLVTGASATNLVTLGGSNPGFTGAVSIQSGTFRLSSSTALTSTNTVHVVGGTLGGTVSVAAAVNVAAGGTLAPGNTSTAATGTLATGNLTLAGKLLAEIDTDLSIADQVAVTGTVDVTDGTLDLSLTGVADGQTFVLVHNDGDLISNGADAIVGSLAGLTRGGESDSAAFDNGLFQGTIYYGYDAVSSSFTGGNDLAIQFASVPEPGMFVLLSVAPIALLTGRRKRRRASSETS